MNKTITLPGILRDFQSDHPDFEYRISPGGEAPFSAATAGQEPVESGIIGPTLGADAKPIYQGGPAAPDKRTTTTPENFNQWFNDVPGVNKTVAYELTLTESVPGSGIYTFDSDTDSHFKTLGGFFPLDGLLFGNIRQEIFADDRGRQLTEVGERLKDKRKQERKKLRKINNYPDHNYHFTYEIRDKFLYKGGEVFTFTGDDDVWVFINKKLAIDIGGVHQKRQRTVKLDEKAAELGITKGKVYSIDFFFAERHTTEANFRIETSIVPLPFVSVKATKTPAHKKDQATGQPIEGEFTITLNRKLDEDLTVNFTVSGSAVPDVDYVALPNQVTFPAGQDTQTLPVRPLGQPPLGASSADVIITLQDREDVYQIGERSATVEIIDYVPHPIVSVKATKTPAHKKDQVTGQPVDGEFTITLDQKLAKNLTVDFTVGGSAIPSVDYVALPNQVTFLAGQDIQTLPVRPLGQPPIGVSASDVMITLQPKADTYQVSKSSATVKITDICDPPPQPIVSVQATMTPARKRGPVEGEFTFTLDQKLNQDLTVNFAVGGSAIPNVDYSALPSQVTFPAGQNTQKLRVRPLGQPPEGFSSSTVIVTLQDRAGVYQVHERSATVEIIDNEPISLPQCKIVADPGRLQKPAVGTVATNRGRFIITLNRPAPQNLAVQCHFGGDARPGRDYQPQLPTTILFNQGEQSKILEVTPLAPESILNVPTRVITATLQAGVGYERCEPFSARMELFWVRDSGPARGPFG
ncbi:MAG: fibro-slime domain-containing protein [Cyanothece sp. SIO1E1]|nr:fibro-slime domain-containing protein [Cyanothece sp. SIO1E1]